MRSTEIPEDFKILRPWRARDEVFDALVKTQATGDKPFLFAASYDGEFYGHHRVGALADIDSPDPSMSFVHIMAFHDENFPDSASEKGVSQRGMLKRSSSLAINSIEQAQAVARALVAVFGPEVMDGP